MRVAVIGVGYFGRLHTSKYHALSNVSLIGVVDKNEERAKSVAKEFSTPGHVDVDAIIGKVDAVSIATPAMTHYALARRFLEAGVHVLVEKPLAGTLDEADHLIALAAQKKLILQVGHQERFVFARFDAETLARNPYAITCRRAGPYTGRGLDCNVVLDLMIHDLDLAHRLMDFEPRVIQARGRAVHGSLEDEVEVEIDCGNDRTLMLFASRVGDHLERFIKVETPECRFEIDFTRRQFKFERRGPDGQIMASPPGSVAPPLPELEKQDPLGEEIAAFIACVLNARSPMVSGRDGRRALATALLINEALKRTKSS